MVGQSPRRGALARLARAWAARPAFNLHRAPDAGKVEPASGTLAWWREYRKDLQPYLNGIFVGCLIAQSLTQAYQAHGVWAVIVEAVILGGLITFACLENRGKGDHHD